ncbi:hypothetical protein GCM10027075_21140 [Streptomyces heilongjiangensis]
MTSVPQMPQARTRTRRRGAGRGRGSPGGSAPGVVPRTEPDLFAAGVPGMAPGFAGQAAAPDGSLQPSANGEGTVLRPTPRPTPTPLAPPPMPARAAQPER